MHQSTYQDVARYVIKGIEVWKHTRCPKGICETVKAGYPDVSNDMMYYVLGDAFEQWEDFSGSWFYPIFVDPVVMAKEFHMMGWGELWRKPSDQFCAFFNRAKEPYEQYTFFRQRVKLADHCISYIKNKYIEG